MIDFLNEEQIKWNKFNSIVVTEVAIKTDRDIEKLIPTIDNLKYTLAEELSIVEHVLIKRIGEDLMILDPTKYEIVQK